MGVTSIVLAIALLPAYLSLLSPNRVTVIGYRSSSSSPSSSRVDNHAQTILMSSRLDDETVLSSSLNLKEPRLERLPTITYKLVDDEEDALRAADLCIDVFFGKVKNPIHGLLLKKLRRQQSFDLLQRLWHRPSDDSMVTAKDSKGNLLGFAETFIWSVDAEIYSSYLGYPASAPLVEVNGRIYLPKLANLAVVPSYRKMGMGRQLVEACITQARYATLN